MAGVVPKNISQCTPEWLIHAIKSEVKGSKEVQVLKLQPGKVKNGILSSVAFGRVNISYADGRPKEDVKLFIKIQPENEELIEIIGTFGQDVTEIDAYKTTLQDLMKYEKEKIGTAYFKSMIPRYLCGGYENKAQEGQPRGFFLVLEDVTPEFDVKDFNTGMTKKEISICLDRLAKFHCLGYAYRKEKNIEFNKTYRTLSTFLTMENRLQQYINTVTSSHLLNSIQGTKDEAELTEIFKAVEGKICLKLMEIIKQEPYQNFLVHGDFWVNNIMMTKDSDNCVIIDWQFLGVGSCFSDFGLIVFHSGDPKEMDANLEHYIDVYYNTWKRISAQLKTDVPWTKEECRRLALKTGLYSALYYAFLTADRLVMHPDIGPRLHWIMKKCKQYCPEYL